MDEVKPDGARFRTIFVLVLVLGVSGLFLAVIWPFVQTLLIGAIFAGLCRPLFVGMVKLFRGRRGLASASTLIILILLVLGPLSAFIAVVVQQALEVSDQAIPWLQKTFGEASTFDANKWIVERFPMIADFVPSQQEILTTVGTATKAAGGWLVAGASTFTAGTAGFLLNFFVMVYAMYFFLKDGGAILEKILYFMPLGPEDEERMLGRFVSVTRATVKGTLLIGLIQGGLAGLAFWVAGIKGAAFWGTIMVILSVVPGVGAALVWVPAVIYLFVMGKVVPATLLALWCAAVVGTIDNVLRPSLVGKDAEMPDLLILIGTLGGLFFFGPIGFIIGPIVCGLFLTVWDIYGETFRHLLPAVRSTELPDTPKPPTTPKKK